MSEIDERIIESSKTKVIVMVIGALLFVALGVWMSTLDADYIESQGRFNNPTVVRGVGIAAVVFFSLCAVLGTKLLFRTKPGLILSSKGIVDDSSGVAAGHIPWSDIVGFSIYEIHKQKMLVVKVVDPEKYIAVGGAIKQALHRANYKLCGSPIAIASNTLKIGFDELTTLVNEYHKKYGTK
jgi:hypothetical protein